MNSWSGWDRQRLPFFFCKQKCKTRRTFFFFPSRIRQRRENIISGLDFILDPYHQIKVEIVFNLPTTSNPFLWLPDDSKTRLLIFTCLFFVLGLFHLALRCQRSMLCDAMRMARKRAQEWPDAGRRLKAASHERWRFNNNMKMWAAIFFSFFCFFFAYLNVDL